MSIQSEIDRISGNVQDTISTIRQTGVTIPSGANSDNLPSLAAALANEKQDKLTGAEGQFVGFDSSGNAVAQDAPQSGITQEQADARYVPLTQKGAANGVATLGNDGKIPEGQLPDMDFIPVINGGITGNFAALKSDGTLQDSGKNPSDFAPSGYGLGSLAADVPIGQSGNRDLNAATKNGWYYIVTGNTYENSPIGQPGFPIGGYHVMRVDAWRTVVQTIYFGYQYFTGCVAKRTSNVDSTSWSDWEWVNPPLQIGVEYRTTERYMGRPVYVKLVDCGVLTNGKVIEAGIANIREIVRYQGYRSSSAIPAINNNSLTDAWTSFVASINYDQIKFGCGESAAGASCSVAIWYTKTTD